MAARSRRVGEGMVRPGGATRRSSSSGRSVRLRGRPARLARVMRRGPRWLVGALAMPAALGLLFVLLPRFTGADWDETTDRVAGVPLPQIWQLVGVWAAGLWLHTF